MYRGSENIHGAVLEYICIRASVQCKSRMELRTTFGKNDNVDVRVQTADERNERLNLARCERFVSASENGEIWEVFVNCFNPSSSAIRVCDQVQIQCARQKHA